MLLLLSVESGRSIIHFHYENRKTFNLRNITRVQYDDDVRRNALRTIIQFLFRCGLLRFLLPLTQVGGGAFWCFRCFFCRKDAIWHTTTVSHTLCIGWLLKYCCFCWAFQMLITFWIRLCSVLNLMVMRIDSFYYVIAFYLINNVLTNIPFPHYLLIPGDDKPTLQFANPPRTVIIAITTLSM